MLDRVGTPTTKYVATGGGHVAYQVFGDGPQTVLFITNWMTNLDVMWDEPALAAYLRRLASFSRVVCFYKRGTGGIIVSGTVRDLVFGSGVTFVDRGEHELRGVPGTWPLFSVA